MKGPIARATAKTSIVLVARLVTQAGTLVAVARLLGPAEFGAFVGMAALALMLGTLSNFGTHLILLREISRAAARRDEVLPYALSATVSCGVLLLLAFLGVTLLLLRPHDIDLGVIVCIGAAEILLQPLLALCASEHHGHARVAGSQMLVIAPLVLRLCVALALWLLMPKNPLQIYALGYLCASVIVLAIGLRTLGGAWPPPSKWRWPHRNEWIEASGFAVLSLTAMGPTELDKPLALRLLPATMVGVYAASARVLGALILPVMAMMLAAMPRLFREAEQAPRGTLLRAIFIATLCYGVAGAAVLWLAAPLLEPIFGWKYQGVGEMLRWLTLATPGMALRIAAGSALMARNRPWLRAGFELLGIGTLAVAALCLAPRHPVIGMPLAVASSEWAMALAGWSILRLRMKALPINPRA